MAVEESKAQDHLLCLLPWGEPTELLDRIRHNHPNLKVTYKTIAHGSSARVEGPDELYRDATVLATLNALPSGSEKIPKIKFVSVFTAGTNHLEKSPVYQDLGITFTNSSGIHGPSIAEWVIMTSLVSSRHYNKLYEWQKKHHYAKGQEDFALFSNTDDNVGRRLGVLGYGSIGRQVANVGKAMGMDVIAYTASPRETPESKKDDGYYVPGVGDPDGTIPSAWYSGLDKESLHNFLSQDIDMLVVSLPLTKTTRHILGKEEFEILAKKNAFVSNIARGEVLVQKDLIEALTKYEQSEGKEGLRGAALDVQDPEPLPEDDPLWDAPNCIVTPHMSGIGKEYSTRCFDILDTNLTRMEQGKKLLNIVDRAKGYSSNASN